MEVGGPPGSKGLVHPHLPQVSASSCGAPEAQQANGVLPSLASLCSGGKQGSWDFFSGVSLLGKLHQLTSALRGGTRGDKGGRQGAGEVGRAACVSVSTEHICAARQPAEQKPVPLDHSTVSPSLCSPGGGGGGGRPRGSLPSKFSALQVSPGGCLGWRTVVPAARLGECSLEKGLCAGEEETEVGDPGMPRWPRWVSPCLWGQGILPMGKRGFWESSGFSSTPTPPDPGLLASPSWREMQPLGSYRPLGSQGEMVSSR